MSEKTMKLLSKHQKAYLVKVLKNREYFKKLGKNYITVEQSLFDNEYKIYLYECLENRLFNNEIIEYMEL